MLSQVMASGRRVIVPPIVPEYFITDIADMVFEGGLVGVSLSAEQDDRLDILRVRVWVPRERLPVLNRLVGQAYTDSEPWH